LQQVPFRDFKQAKKVSEEAGEIFNICTKLAAFLEKKEQAKKASKEATESLEYLYSTCSKFPSENLSKQKKLQKKQQNLWNICTQLAASSLQRIGASKKSFRRSRRNLQHLY
jgi:hypothetical protein